MKTIILTGGTGYLGRHLSSALETKGYHVLCLRRAFSDEQAEALFTHQPVFAVIHLATCYGRNGESMAELTEGNLLFPLKVLHLAIKHKVKAFLNTDTILTRFLNPYALSKAQFAEWLKLSADNITAVNIRLDHFYGPFDTPNKFIAFLFKSFRENVPELNLTEGAQTRDFTYIDDVVNAYLSILKHSDEFPRGKVTAFEVGTNRKTSIKDLVQLLQRTCGNTATRLNFGALPYRKNEQLDYDLDTTALESLGWKAEVSLEQGLCNIMREEYGTDK